MEIEINKIEINNEEDFKKFIEKILGTTPEEEKRKIILYNELGDTVEKTKKMIDEILDEKKETVEELEMILEVHKDVLKVCEKILENRKSH